MNEQGRTGRRAQVLRLLRDAAEPLSVIEIAEQLGIHPNTVRFHLDSLVTLGQIEQVASPRRTPGRPPQLFRPVPRMDPTGPRSYRVLAEMLVDALGDGSDAAARATETGRAWGRRAAALQAERADEVDDVDRLVDLLDEFGFEPDRMGAEAPTVGLRNCPFLEVAEQRQDVVCSIHLGLMRGALQGWESPAQVRRLTPFAQPNLCVAELVADAAR